jgi:plastocyanin
MKRALIGVAVLLTVPAAALGQGAVQEVATGDDFFEPENLSTDVGTESFHWRWGPDSDPPSFSEHNVREENKLFYSGPTETSGEFTATPSAGTFLYVCDAHGVISGDKVLGMGGEIAVKPTATPQGKKVLVTWATEATDTGTQFDVRQQIGSKKPEVVESKTKKLEAVFKLKGGKKYKFDVRSRQGKAASRWSPKLTVKG